ncbi:P-loop NTPase [Phycicoccus avicenniae]|uniref:P-loop NTPase n=1 Tax=Phycicoccus avicenniae TaxID=2828860 RepID=UPI003D2BC617
MTTVLTALTHRHEAAFVEVLGEAPGITLVRRCADLAELLSTGAAGVARVAVVSPDLRGLDRDALRHLAGHGVRVAGLVTPEDEEGERRLRQLGVATVLHPGDDAGVVAAALGALADATTSRPGGPAEEAPDDLPAPDPRVPTRVTVVWGPTGAPGRSTVAVTLAARLAAAGIRTLLVDLDTWGASVAQLLGLVDEAPGVAAAARASEQGTLDVPGLARLAPEVLPRLRVLTGLPRADRWRSCAPAPSRTSCAWLVASSTTSSSTPASPSRTTRS